MGNRTICIAISTIASILLIVTMLLTSIELVAFNKSFYKDQYRKNDTAAVIGVEEAELIDITQELFLYLKNNRENLKIKWSKGDSIFGNREIEHMKDVKQLFLYGFKIRNFALLLAICLTVTVAIVYPKIWLRQMMLSFLSILLIVGLISAMIGVAMVIDFDLIWDKFHHIFFDNDLWLLNPDTDVLIMMMPGTFFMSMIKTIAILFFMQAGLVLALAFTYKKKAH